MPPLRLWRWWVPAAVDGPAHGFHSDYPEVYITAMAVARVALYKAVEKEQVEGTREQKAKESKIIVGGFFYMVQGS